AARISYIPEGTLCIPQLELPTRHPHAVPIFPPRSYIPCCIHCVACFGWRRGRLHGSHKPATPWLKESPFIVNRFAVTTWTQGPSITDSVSPTPIPATNVV
ncbi:hypothetical protein BKA70DRAFT_1556220, partial [Coprinopsis sp. MPI-PUGE-AT-0042]